MFWNCKIFFTKILLIVMTVYKKLEYGVINKYEH